MGGSLRYDPPTPHPSTVAAQSARGHHASALSEDLIRIIADRVLSDTVEGERECYEVARDLRSTVVQSLMQSAVADRVPGSERPRPGKLRGMDLCDRIVMTVTDLISNEIIRPGPTPEDRVASDIRGEMWAIRTQVEQAIRLVIAVEDQIEGLPTHKFTPEEEFARDPRSGSYQLSDWKN